MDHVAVGTVCFAILCDGLGDSHVAPKMNEKKKELKIITFIIQIRYFIVSARLLTLSIKVLYCPSTRHEN